MKKYWQYLLIILLAWSVSSLRIVAAGNLADTEQSFIVKPYLQLGNHPLLKEEEELELFWVTNSNQDIWGLEVKTNGKSQWTKQQPPQESILSYSVPDKLYIWHNAIAGLRPGEKFQYKLLKNGNIVFSSTGSARKGFDDSYKVVLFGDTGADTLAERKVVYQSYLQKPDCIIILGDIVYNFGRLSEYLAKFFPVFSSEKASAELGAPLLQSIVTLPVIGNHDIAYGDNKRGIDLDKLRDGLAFYQLWSAPLNGPIKSDDDHNIAKLIGNNENISRYLKSAGSRYPTMSNYSFDYGNSHWLILDANPYMSWTNQKLRNWVRQDLENNKAKTWKFVCFHQPGFSIDKAHSTEQRMRLLSDIFQECGVNMVFSGHAHNYQRSYPMTFHPSSMKAGTPCTNSNGTVDGAFTLDKQFDGKGNSHPSGVIYIVSGAGGAALYGVTPHMPDSTNFTDKFIASTHSLTLCVINKNELKCNQISEDGNVLDSFVIKK